MNADNCFVFKRALMGVSAGGIPSTSQTRIGNNRQNLPQKKRGSRDPVSQSFKTELPRAAVQGSSGTMSGAAEERIRQLIANGKHKVAVEAAKDFHKAQRTAASEALLVDAYAGRIKSLTE